MDTEHTRGTKRKAAGFTLVELMVVIVILGLLAALVVPNLIGVADDANVAAAKAQIKAFQTALVNYKLVMKRFPSTSEGLEALINNEKGRRFLESDRIPVDPWNNPFVYKSPGSQGRDYEIVSYGADGAPGGSGYAADIESWNLQGN